MTAMRWVNLVVFIASVLATAVAVNVIAQSDQWRARFDATKTRAYSLSEQTRTMLSGLEGDWTVALVMIEAHADRATRRQIDEVLSRFTQASQRISVVRVDPTDPRTLGGYESLLTQLRSRYSGLTAEYEEYLDRGIKAYERAMIFAQQQSGTLDELARAAAQNPELRVQLADALRRMAQQAQAISLIAEQGPAVIAEIEKARRVSDEQPIPDYDVARSILVAALNAIADELYEHGEQYGRWIERDEAQALAQHLREPRREFESLARELAAAADPLNHLPSLELSTIGRQLASGECAVILAPERIGRAAVIPSSQLFPVANIRQISGGGGVAFDQRFRGEQLVAAGMRSLLVPHMPMVVFVHAEERTLMRPRDRHADLTGIASQLIASRFDVREWIVGGQGAMERPTPARGQPVVYVIVPPAQRAGLEPSRQERALLLTAERLLTEGAPVLLSVYPSLLPRYGQVDPWAQLAQSFGVRAETSRAIYESMRVAADAMDVQQGQTVQRYSAAHPIGRALDGQQSYFGFPVPLHISAGSDATGNVIAAVEAAPNRWLEPNWITDPLSIGTPSDEQRFHEAQPIIVASQRPGSGGRAIIVGSGNWMLSSIADAAVSIGGNRAALLHPGNTELMLASVAWLAGMDDLIAQSPAAQEVARLGEIGERANVAWFWILVVGLPLASLLAGAFIWGVRRR